MTDPVPNPGSSAKSDVLTEQESQFVQGLLASVPKRPYTDVDWALETVRGYYQYQVSECTVMHYALTVLRKLAAQAAEASAPLSDNQVHGLVVKSPPVEVDSKQSGSSTEYGYRVQLRNSSPVASRPVILRDGTVVGRDWVDLHFLRTTDPAGVPCSTQGYKDKHELLSFQAATALGWTTLAQLDRSTLEFRLMQYQLVTQFQLVEVGESKVPQRQGGCPEAVYGTVNDSVPKPQFK